MVLASTLRWVAEVTNQLPKVKLKQFNLIKKHFKIRVYIIYNIFDFIVCISILTMRIQNGKLQNISPRLLSIFSTF